VNDIGINRRKFLNRTAAVGLGVLAHPTFNGNVFGANERIVMGIIGPGGMGRHHMSVFSDLGVQWGAVCDVYEPNRDQGLELADPNAKGYDDHRRLLERRDIDAVLITTPEHWHHRHLIDALQAGKDAYCEKPMSHSIQEGAEMVAAARKTDRVVQIGMQRRSSPTMQECKQLLDDGTIGEINLVRAEWYWNVELKVRPVVPGKLDWEHFVGPARKQPFDPVRFRHWRYFWDFSGGNMTDQGTHLMDVVQWFTNAAQPSAAYCSGEVYKLRPSETPDTFCAVFEYPNFTCTWTLCYSSSYESGWGLVFQGHKGTLEICESGYRVYAEPWGGSPYAYARWNVPKPAVEKLPGEVTSTQPHTANFLECVRTRKQPNATVELGHQAVRTLHLANVAWHKKTLAVLAEDGSTIKV
jgi:predicted dehydrogenase